MTTRSSRTGVAPNPSRASTAAQCEVARFPFKTLADPRISEPVQTEVVHVELASIMRTHSWIFSSAAAANVPSTPPGTTRMSAAST